jgi:hypothetical protein
MVYLRRSMRKFPAEFADLLNARGQRLLEGDDERAASLGRDGQRFVSLPRLIEPAKARACLALLEELFLPSLTRMDEPIPPTATWGMAKNYSELLPKAARVSTLMLESARGRGFQLAKRVGLLDMLRSPTLHRLAEVLNGRPLKRRGGVQLLCYGAKDYAGPHNDHHPEDADAQDGYVDVHMTFATLEVRRQLLVYERRGHFEEVVDVNMSGGITAYRLPFWHYTTPLEARRGREASARRWVLLGTFLDARR